MEEAVLCPHCQVRILNDGRLSGHHVTCPHCHGRFLMPPLTCPPQHTVTQDDVSVVGTQPSFAPRGSMKVSGDQDLASVSPAPPTSPRRRLTAISISVIVLAACALVIGVLVARHRSYVAITIVSAGVPLVIADGPQEEYPRFFPSIDTVVVLVYSRQGALTAELPVLVRQKGEESRPYMTVARPLSATNAGGLSCLLCFFRRTGDDLAARVAYRGRDFRCNMREKQAFERMCISLGELKAGDMILKTSSYLVGRTDEGRIELGRQVKTQDSVVWTREIYAQCVSIESVSQ